MSNTVRGGRNRSNMGGGGAQYRPPPPSTYPAGGTPGPAPTHLIMQPHAQIIQGSAGPTFPQQPPRRQALLQQPMAQPLPISSQIPSIPSTQRPQHLQQRYQPQVNQQAATALYPHMMQQHFMYNQFQPQHLYTGPANVPMYPNTSVRAQQPYGGGGGQSQRGRGPVKKGRSNAVAIVDAETKEVLDVGNLKGGVAGGGASTAASGVQTDEMKRSKFKEQMQELHSSDTPTATPPPNAIISDVAQDQSKKQEVRRPVIISDPPPVKPVSKPVAVADQPAETVVAAEPPPSSVPVKPVPEPVKPVDPKPIPVAEPVKPVPDTKPVQPSTSQPVKLDEAPPLLPTPPTSNEVTKDTLASSIKMAKEKEGKKEREDDLSSIDRSTTELKSDSSTSLDSQRQPRAVPPPPVTASSVSSSSNIISTNKGGGLLATPSTPPVQSLGDNYNSTGSKLNSSASSVVSNGSQTSDKSSSDLKEQLDSERVQTEEEEEEEERRDEEEVEEEEEEEGVESEEAESMSGSEKEPLPTMTLAKDGLLDIPNGHDKDTTGFLKDGRYVYNREFLLQYSFLPLPAPSAIKDTHDIYTPHKGAFKGIEMLKKVPPPPRRKVISHDPSKTEKVELRKAENRWTRPVVRGEGIDTDTATEELFRKFQGILNKLTPQKFKNLAEHARDLEINTEERLKGCIDKIFSKALEEPNFSVAYAHLCRVLSFIKVEIVKVDDNGDEVVKETTFRRELLTRCQKEFEKDKRDDETKEEMLKAIEEAAPEERKIKEAELKEWENKARKRSLGNIRFIGELFKLKMLSESIMHECIVRLLRSTSDEDALECFSRLITTTGKELDHPQAKQRLDRYFERISEIIEKKKISSRIRFMLQDVQEMRKNDWVSRRQETLKTIDQIHQEAEMEAIQEKEMIRSLQPVSGKQYQRDEKKRGKGDDYSSGRKGDKMSGRRDSTPDVTRITALSSRKEKTGPTLGPGTSLRPPGWKAGRNQGQTPPPPASGSSTESKDKSQTSKPPQRSSSSGTKKQAVAPPTSGRGSAAVPSTRRSQSDERSETIKAIKEFMSHPNTPSQATPTHAPVRKDRLTEDVVERKTTTIIDELSQNNDYKEAIECVLELESPGLLHVFVRTGINHSLEKSSSVRVVAGKLFDKLMTEKHLPSDKLILGLQEMLECGEDLEVDIPKVWDFFAEIVSPLTSTNNLPLNDYVKLLRDISLDERRISRNVARTLKNCVKHCGSKERVCQLWKGCGLKWAELGVSEGDLEGFLKDEDISFLLDSASSGSSSDVSTEIQYTPPHDPPYLKDLSSLFGSANHTNDEIFEWIEKKVSIEDANSTQFIKTLSRAAVCGSTSGEGSSAIYNDDTFAKRLPLLKKWVDQEVELQEVVLDAIQIGVTILKHPPGLLHKMFSSLYAVELISEPAFWNWKSKGRENFGRGVALQSSKKFFHWLEHAEAESDTDTGS